MKGEGIDRRPQPQAAYVVHPVRPRETTVRDPEARLAEAIGLAEALDLIVKDGEVANLRKTTPGTLFGGGKVEEIGGRLEDAEIDVVVIDGVLSPVQQRNLERAWNRKVVDRTGLILEIFARRARTREGKLQVELARLEYERSRLVRTWTHLERQRGGTGSTGGPGETQIELDRRLIADRIVRLKDELDEVRRTRQLHRKARKKIPYPVVALVGYTNAGKSTLFNRLTAAKVEAKDMLFATLDPTLRQVALPGGRPAMLSDTVGFISDLPHELVEAFRATLEEVQEADVVLHVRDVANPDSEAQAADVRQVLDQLDIGEDRKLIEVWNKLDLLPFHDRAALEARARRSAVPVARVSAVSGEGVDDLLAQIAGMVDDAPEMEAVLPAGEGQALAWLYQHGSVISREADEAGDTHVSVRLSDQAMGRFERLFPDARLRLAAE